jgi:hypothetical protein
MRCRREARGFGAGGCLLPRSFQFRAFGDDDEAGLPQEAARTDAVTGFDGYGGVAGSLREIGEVCGKLPRTYPFEIAKRGLSRVYLRRSKLQIPGSCAAG